MDILKILEESGKDLYPEDLDFFETELSTGKHYKVGYQKLCRQKIKELRAWLGVDTGQAKKTRKKDKNQTPNGPVVDIENLAPKASNPIAAALTPEQVIFNDITAMREESSYKTNFKKYVAGRTEIDAAFVDRHYSFFQQWELDAIVSVKQLGEEFLEKYFGALDKEKIARYQIFSESFFMKHYSQLNATIVLTKGKNEWRKKEKRSKQLDVFLRLKGVKL